MSVPTPPPPPERRRDFGSGVVVGPLIAVLVVVTAALVLGACSGGTKTTRSPTSKETNGSPTNTTPSTSSFVPPTVVSFAPSVGTNTATWDLVALGDSNVAGWGVRPDEPFTPSAAFPGVYARLLADQQQVTVALHSYYPDQIGNEVRTVAEWAAVVRADRSMRTDLRHADVVIVLIGFHDVLGPLGSCPGGTTKAFVGCLDEATSPMPAAFARLYGEISSLVPAHTKVLVSDYFGLGPLYAQWSSDPRWPKIRWAAFHGWRSALEKAAAAAGLTVVHTTAAMAWPSGEPRYDVTAITSDELHFNAKGHRLIAQVFLREDGLA